MSVIQYKCDTCNRVIDIPQNEQGLEVIQKCVITDGCHGKLSQIAIKLDHIRGNFPSKVDGLNDYIQRRILYNHQQTISLMEWTVTHNLGVSPFIQVFIERPKAIINIEDINLDNPDSLIELVEVEPVEIKTNNINEIVIVFDKPEKGIAQLIAKTSNKGQVISTGIVDETIVFKTLSNSGEVSIATINEDSILNLELTFSLPNGDTSILQYTVDDNPSINSPWVDYNKVYIDGKTYTVRSFNLLDEDFSTITNGSSFAITNLTDSGSLQIDLKELLFLQSDFPYATNDKVINSYVDLLDVEVDKSINQTVYNNGELSINEIKIKNIYPYIKKV